MTLCNVRTYQHSYSIPFSGTLYVRIVVASASLCKAGGTIERKMKQIRYTPEQKLWALEQMKPPLNRTVVELAKETGITAVTLRTWRDAARQEGQCVPAGQPRERWSSTRKFQAVLQTAPLSEEEIATYCRTRGILPEQLQQWRQACEQANGGAGPVHEQGRVISADTQQQLRNLERELQRKTEALAEAAALLVLRKKADAIWGKDEDV
ncbi:Transposase [Delftia acidovorans]|nr:Transposase [Delftia acidovorans]